jgi:hypothetical protein
MVLAATSALAACGGSDARCPEGRVAGPDGTCVLPDGSAGDASQTLDASMTADAASMDSGLQDAAMDAASVDSGLQDAAMDAASMDSGHQDAALDGGADAAADGGTDAGSTTFLTDGFECGDAFVLANVAHIGAYPGDYTVQANGAQGDTVELRHEGSVVDSVSYDWMTTIGAEGSGDEYTFTFPSFFELVVAKQGSGTRNLYNLNQCLFDGMKVLRVEGEPMVAGMTYGPFVVVSVEDLGAPSGDYTFLSNGAGGDTVELRQNGSVVDSISYDWMTTIGSEGSGIEYTFTFPGYFDVVIAKDGSGTRNLYEINKHVFDGKTVYTVP